jgi:hypothetical protein
MMQWSLLVTLLLAGVLTGCDSGKIDLSNNTAIAMGKQRTESPCLNQNPLRNAYFGDLHVHTAYSADAWHWSLRLTPQDAYRYAFGETVLLPPNQADDNNQGTRPAQIDRPLDFAGVTDHSEFLAESRLCIQPDSAAYSTDFCNDYRVATGRSIPLAMRIFSPFSWRNDDVCGDDGELCAEASRDVWRDTVAAAQDWHDFSEDCQRTTFVAYEYSSHRMGSNLHRNVIFRNATVPPIPTSYIEESREWKLWQRLKSDCLDAGNGCDVLAIPHNSNISNGRMFAVDYPETASVEEQAARARLRIKLEPIVEIMQHKGDSECRNGLSGVLTAVDELCDFEKFEKLAFTTTSGTADVDDCYEGPLADWVPHKGPNCLSRLNYVRSALTEGLKEEQRLGVNPFKFGLTASTDTHNALAGGVMEQNFQGHLGTGDDSPLKRVTYNSDVGGNASNGPGGLIGIWAEENARGALFDSMKRKEVFGTSGPRIQPRFFGGWDYSATLCDDPSLLQKAYAQGVPMGADLPPAQGKDAPVFIASALADAGTAQYPGTQLQRLQVVKGWVDDNGVSNEQVYDIAGAPDSDAAVDLDSCRQSGSGFSQLCTVWQDPDFDATRAAVYYLRAVENPSCRYSALQCVQLPEDQRPADCQHPEVRRAIQERAWSSPIWYTPG